MLCNVQLWHSAAGSLFPVHSTHTNVRVTCGLFPADRNYLLTQSRDNTLKVIDLRMSQVVATLWCVRVCVFGADHCWPRGQPSARSVEFPADLQQYGSPTLTSLHHNSGDGYKTASNHAMSAFGYVT